MALTIRDLSSGAAENLERIMAESPSLFKTKTKTIDFVLKTFYTNETFIKELERKIEALEVKNERCTAELSELKNALNCLFDSIKR